jgi:thiol-disulfide isomerase/thioredoxin
VSDKIENLTNEKSLLEDSGLAPDLTGINGWINTEPLTQEDLKGKVVLIDFWTYSCINCIRTLPHLSKIYDKYKNNGFILLGVHSPEFDFEKKKENVLNAVKEYDLKYPIALDNEHDTWKAYENQYWPAHYLLDINGNIRYKQFGEGHYKELETAIQQALLEGNLLSLDKISVVTEPEPDAIFKNIGTPEIYLGYLRINNIGNTDQNVRPGEAFNFKGSDKIEENRFYLEGNWKIEPEFSETTGENSSLTIRYKASKLNLVLASLNEEALDIDITLDGKPLTLDNQGDDIESSSLKVTEPRLYNLVDTVGDYDWHTLKLSAPKGLQAFAFTFG